MLIMAYDFETTGMPLFDQPSDDPRQPHVVQAAAALFDTETRKVISGFDLIVQPDGWDIPGEVAAIHGINTDFASQVGVPESFVINAVWSLWQAADQRLGHNESFDARIMRIALKRFEDDETADTWKAGAAECTARLAKPIMKMAPTAAMVAAGRRHSKTPKLAEAFEHFIGRPMENAHSAMADVRACMAVYFAIQDLDAGVKPPEPPPRAAKPSAGDTDIPFL